MKTLILILAVTASALTGVQSSAGECRIAPSPHFQPHWEPAPPCRIAPRPVCPPVEHCYVAPPIPEVCPPVQRCRIRFCEPIVPRCTIRLCEPRMCSKCPGQVCHCHERPVQRCRIQPCKPVHTCRIVVCKPVHTCRIQPCEPTYLEPTYPEPAYVDPSFGPGTQPQPHVTPPVDLPEVQAGQEVTIDGGQFGFEPGTVAVRVGGLVLQAQVTGWTANEVRAILPTLPLADSAQAQVAVLDASGQIANQLDVVMVPQTQQLARR